MNRIKIIAWLAIIFSPLSFFFHDNGFMQLSMPRGTWDNLLFEYSDIPLLMLASWGILKRQAWGRVIFTALIALQLVSSGMHFFSIFVMLEHYLYFAYLSHNLALLIYTLHPVFLILSLYFLWNKKAHTYFIPRKQTFPFQPNKAIQWSVSISIFIHSIMLCSLISVLPDTNIIVPELLKHILQITLFIVAGIAILNHRIWGRELFVAFVFPKITTFILLLDLPDNSDPYLRMNFLSLAVIALYTPILLSLISYFLFNQKAKYYFGLATKAA